MALTLYSHPFSSYCQKVLVALWENDVPFTYRHLEDQGAAEERARLWPLGRFPVLVDDGRVVPETSIIIEHLDLHHPGPVRLLPEARGAGHAAALFAWLEEEAARAGCDQLHLDSGVRPERETAHRFYFNHGLRIGAYHFQRPL